MSEECKNCNHLCNELQKRMTKLESKVNNLGAQHMIFGPGDNNYGMGQDDEINDHVIKEEIHICKYSGCDAEATVWISGKWFCGRHQ